MNPLYSFSHGILGILIPVWAALSWDSRDLGSQTGNMSLDPVDLESWLGKLSWDMVDLESCAMTCATVS